MTTPGELAQLARALAWHARGRRFDSDILHTKTDRRSVFFLSRLHRLAYQRSSKLFAPAYHRRFHINRTLDQENAGLQYNFDQALVTNSLKGHRLIQYAKTKGPAGEAQERLFLAYFTQGKNLNDLPTQPER